VVGKTSIVAVATLAILAALPGRDILVVSRKGGRVVLRTTDGEVMAQVLVRRTAKTIEFASVNPAHPNLVFPVDRINWITRIVWASR
jgi:phage repressor protein C with HTH and peptisase S24 domain